MAKEAPDTITEEDLMLSPADVMGDSSLVRARAKTILDAQKKVKEELAKAKAALAELEKLKKEADEEQLIATIEAQIELAKRRIKTIEDLLAAEGELAKAVMMVTKGKTETDAQRAAAVAAKAKEVAKEVEDAATFSLGLTTDKFPKQTGGETPPKAIIGTMIIYNTNNIPDVESTEFDNKDLRRLAMLSTKGLVLKHNAGSDTKSFKEIFGADKVMLRTTGLSSTNPIEVVSFEGMPAKDDADTPVTRTPVASSTGSIGPHNYKGIAGRILCLDVSTCSVSNGKLGAGWYWTGPANKDYTRWKMNDEGKYEEYNDYANYGYWLIMPTQGDEAGTIAKINTFGRPAYENNATTGSLAASSTIPGNNKATYTGKAIGISVLTDDKNNAMDSGQFTADVTLEARFGSAPTVEGTVTNFKGNAVDTGWEVTLEEAKLREQVPTSIADHFGLTTAEGDFEPDELEDGTDVQGRWHARAYGGSSDKRPTGITGDFHSIFTNGRAVGGYATRIVKDEE